MALNAVTGNTGQGKTYVMTAIGRNAMLAGLRVGANWPLRPIGAGTFELIENNEQLLKFSGGVLLIDESQKLYNSRNWGSLADEILAKFQEHRKDDLHIWISAQDLSRVDVALRELVAHYYEVKKLLGGGEPDPRDVVGGGVWNEIRESLGGRPRVLKMRQYGKPWGLIRMREFVPADRFLKTKKSLDTRYFFIRRGVTEMYDTRRKIVKYQKGDGASYRAETMKKKRKPRKIKVDNVS